MKTIDIDLAVQKLQKISEEYKTPIIDLIEAQTKEPWKVLVGTILSARTNDKTTADATKKLFKKVKQIDELANLSLEEIEKIIFPVGFYRNKARFLKKLPLVLKEKFDGRIPGTVEELVVLPGVGRKTANLVVAVAFHKNAICVDTHVHRIMNIWKYVNTKTPFDTEMALRKKLPVKYWRQINYLLVSHGQSICRPISPRCDECVLVKDCPKSGVKPRKNKKVKTMNKKDKYYEFIAWNVNGVRAVEKKGLIQMVESSNAEIFAIQETKASKDQLSDELLNIKGYQSYWCSAQKKGYSGVAVYTKIEPIQVNYGLGIEEFDSEGRVITLEFEDFYFLNCYFPNAQHELKRLDYKLGFNQVILDYCKKLKKKKNVVICGDFNVAHRAIDLKNPKANEKNPGFSIQERNSMDKFLESGFIDTFRVFNKEAENYTWWSYRFNARQKNIGWRIDYFCVDKKSQKRLVNAFIKEDVMGSDHCPVGILYKKNG